MLLILAALLPVALGIPTYRLTRLYDFAVPLIASVEFVLLGLVVTFCISGTGCLWIAHHR